MGLSLRCDDFFCGDIEAGHCPWPCSVFGWDCRIGTCNPCTEGREELPSHTQTQSNEEEVLDEMSLLMNQFFSSTMDEYRRVNFETFVRQDTDQAIIMDALLHKVELDMIKILRSGEIKVTRYEDPNPTI